MAKTRNSHDTIQSKIENVLSQLVEKQIEIIGSSRTDAGVHAIAQIANFKLDEHIPESEFMEYLINICLRISVSKR
jgi:tRNA pseudouridine38-40 synthase